MYIKKKERVMTLKALLIAEKPSLMRDIKAVYDKMSYPDEITFIALRGHILELQEPQEYNNDWGTPWRENVLPMIPSKFEFKVKVKDVYDLARKELESGKYDYVINACDAGREGELIFDSVYRHVGVKTPVKRFWASDTTQATIEKALNNLIDGDDKSLVALRASARLRAYFDWLLGMNMSRAVSLKTKKTIPVGRVMTPTLNIIVERELEIMNFKEEAFHELEGDFGNYKGIWFNDKTNETRINTKAEVEKIKARLSKDGVIKSIEDKREINYAPTLHSLLELQKEANTAFGYTAEKTLQIAQSLYEKRKLISYPRTESRYLPKNLVTEIPKRLRPLLNISELAPYVSDILKNQSTLLKSIEKNKRYINDSGVTDHHAIIPTDTNPNLTALDKDELNIYTLIAKRFISIFLNPYIVNRTTLITKVQDEHFKTSGKTLVDVGYRILYKTNEVDVILPKLKEGDKVNLKTLNILNKKTTPPPRYNDSSLLQTMQNPGKFISDEELKMILKETAGLGTSATRADIIEKLVGRAMIARKGKSIYATDFGIKVIEVLKGKDIISPELTASWEKRLADVESLKYDAKTFFNEMIGYTKNETNNVLKNVNANLSESTKEKVGTCPKCGSDVIIGKSYYLCSNYKKETGPSCDFIIGKTISGANITKTDVKGLLSGKETKEKEFTWKSGKKGKAKLKLEAGEVKFLF